MTPPQISRTAAEAGLTLTELMIVIVLAGLVTLGLVAFYLNSQAMWQDASTQVLSQRDATNLAELIREKARTASSVVLTGSASVSFHDSNGDETDRFFWNAGDMLVYYAKEGGTPSPVAPTIVEAFVMSLDDTLDILHLDTLRVRSPAGTSLYLSTAFGLYNRP